MAKKKQKKYYAIKVGKGVRDKIVDTWKECEELVTGYNSIYKSFPTREEAESYLGDIKPEQIEEKREQVRIAIEKKREIKATTKSIHAKIPIELYKKFEKRCEKLGLNEEKTIQSLILETFEEYTDDI